SWGIPDRGGEHPRHRGFRQGCEGTMVRHKSSVPVCSRSGEEGRWEGMIDTGHTPDAVKRALLVNRSLASCLEEELQRHCPHNTFHPSVRYEPPKQSVFCQSGAKLASFAPGNRLCVDRKSLSEMVFYFRGRWLRSRRFATIDPTIRFALSASLS